MENLRIGNRGPGVELLQLGLGRAGTLRDAPDGIFEARTRAALQRFQQSQGLQADGVYGPATAAALRPYLVGYRRITLRAGDTLWRIARRYGISLAEVAAANPDAEPQDLRPGDSLTVPLPFAVVPTSICFTSEVLALCLEGFAARYPEIAQQSMGSSSLGRPLWRLSLGQGPRRVFYNAAHHANEWICTPLLLSFAEQTVQAGRRGGRIGGVPAKQLLSAATVDLAPMVDPDGVDLVCGLFAEGSEPLQRAEAIRGDRVPFPEGWKANIDGVDLNLQYPADWERARQIKFAMGYTSPGPRDYVGSAPLCAPEARAVYKLSRARDYALTLSFHTQGAVIYRASGQEVSEESLRIGQRLAELSGYALAEPPESSSYAGYKDWFVSAYGRPGYTVEAGVGTNPLPLSQYPSISRACLPMLAQAPLLI